jgi:Icc-related predicted phosphoesterase
LKKTTKILSIADLHGSQYRLNIVIKNVEKYTPDLVVICGDITQFGPGEMAKNLLDQIPVETFAVHGNIDTENVLNGIDKSKAKNIHLKRVKKNGIPYIGIGGESHLLFSTRFSFSNNKTEETIRHLIDGSTVLISHIPPFGLQDKVFLGIHSGSKELRKIIDDCKPRLVLCGHIHEDPGYTKTNGTIVVNCSMGKKGEGALIEINKKIYIKMLD